MTFGAVSSDHWAGERRLESADARATFSNEANAASLLWVELSPPRPAVRGRLCLYVEGAIERALDARGAPPPARLSSAAREDVIADQIRRALVSGTSGIALWFASLEAIAGTELSLDTGDSATLRWWLDAGAEHPVRIAFDASNLKLGIYSAPRSLDSLLAEATTSTDDEGTDDEVPVSERYTAVFESDPSELGCTSEDLTQDNRMLTVPARLDTALEAPAAPTPPDENVADLAPELRHDDASGVEPPPPDVVPDLVLAPLPTVTASAEQGMAERARAMAEDIADDSETGWLRHALIELSTPKPSPALRPEAVAEPQRGPEVAPEEADVVMRRREPAVGPSVQPLAIRIVEAPQAAAAAGQPEVAIHAEPDASAAPECLPTGDEVSVADGPRLELKLAEEIPVADAKADVEADAKRKLEMCWRELSAATGPKPLGVVERLFSTAYMPLRAALDRGADMPALRETADDWSQSFEKSYKDGFDALRVRNKRPAMVVDVPDIALRVARLHGARSTQLLLVDSMRYDLGDMVNDRIRAIVGQRAACAERVLLWAALPTSTATQIELIGRGPAGLREPIATTSEELIVGRGRKAQMVRRLKTGHRELLKLDIVAARLAEPQGADPTRFELIADEVAQRIAAHFEGLQPRTLVMIFGDHGFTVERHSDGRTSLSEGGASPEEVMVPAFAWLVGAVH